MSNTLFCPKCAETKEYLNGFSTMSNEHKNFIAGYLIGYEDIATRCPYCKNEDLITIPISNSDFNCIMNTSNDNIDFLNAMISLAEKDPIEYQLKMSQFRNQVAQQKQESSNNLIKCPTCNSTKVIRISTTAKVTNIALFGLLGNKRKKTFHCNNCKYEW